MWWESTHHTLKITSILSATAQFTVISVPASLHFHWKHPGALLLAPECCGTPTITTGFHGAENLVNPAAEAGGGWTAGKAHTKIPLFGAGPALLLLVWNNLAPPHTRERSSFTVRTASLHLRRPSRSCSLSAELLHLHVQKPKEASTRLRAMC